MPVTRPARSTAAIGALFFVNGLAFASWIPRIPEVQSRLGLSASILGLVLAGVGTGGLLGTALYPLVARRIGARPCALAAGVAVALALPLVAVVPSPWLLLGVLVVGGAVDALTDIAMNDLGVAEQQRIGTSIMNRLHAGWSLGAVTGAIAATTVASLGVGVGAHLLGVGILSLLVLAAIARDLPAAVPAARPPASRQSKVGAATVLLPLAFATALVEGVPAEWSAVLLAEVHGLEAGARGLGFSLFAAGMLLGRVGGDRAVARLGAEGTARAASALVLVGVVAIAAGPSAPIAIVGYGLAGLGTSVLFPVVYGLAGTMAALSSGAGLATLSIGARLGFLSGPPIVGVLADATDLRVAVAAVVLVAVLAMTVARTQLERHVA